MERHHQFLTRAAPFSDLLLVQIFFLSSRRQVKPMVQTGTASSNSYCIQKKNKQISNIDGYQIPDVGCRLLVGNI